MPDFSSVLTQLLVLVEQLPAPLAQPVYPHLDPSSLITQLQQGKTAYAQGDIEGAMAALTQVVEWNPGSTIAHQLLSSLYWQQGQIAQSLKHYRLAHSGGLLTDHDPEFQSLVAQISPYTLLSPARLWSLYSLAKQICLDDIPGNMVECGTYKGGSAALLAAVVKRYSLRPRHVYAFDTFQGMPDPTDVDRHAGIPANDTQWGAGTLAAPIAENLQVICEQLEVNDIVIPVAGLFAQTLPQNRATIGTIALLHADGDWYQSTLDIFTTLYDQVVPEGSIQIDDYGYWEGCRQAIQDFQQQRQAYFFLQTIDHTGVWFRKTPPAVPDSNYGATLWHLVQLAEKMGDSALANQAVHAVLKLIPRLTAAEAFLQHLQQSAIVSAAPSPDLALPLRRTNLIIFPDWQQPDDVLCADLVDVLRVVLSHWERQSMALLIDLTGTDGEQADGLLTDAIMYLMTEENLDMSEADPEMIPIQALNPAQWQSLSPRLTARIQMTYESSHAEKAAQIPVLHPDQVINLSCE